MQTDANDLPLSKDALFGTAKAGPTAAEAKKAPVTLKGFIQNETAYTYADPVHWSRAVVRGQVGATGQVSENLKWKATVRADVDPIYQWSNFYPDPVKKDQRFYFLVGETYIDTTLSGWDLRLGRQHIVWGEVVGLFVADVVSAQDQRDFLLPAFDIIRIPQWAARAEYFHGDSHIELVWIPYPSYDKIGKPGADFFPFQIPPPPGFSQSFLGEVQPDHTLSNSNYGVRLSTLKAGWDLSGFYYRSEAAAPTFVRDVVLGSNPTLIYQPVHDRIWQTGATVAKDLGSTVFKMETVYTSGRRYNVTRLNEPTGVVEQNSLDYVFSFDFTLPKDIRLNTQLFQRVFFQHDPDILFDRFETGASIQLSGKLTRTLQPEILWIQSFNRWENLIRPRLNWYPATNWRASFGVDIFNGPITGVFGRFNNRDRMYAEFRYDF